jgi:hypothetical protein
MTDHDNTHANAVAAQLRLAEENGNLPEELSTDSDDDEGAETNREAIDAE